MSAANQPQPNPPKHSNSSAVTSPAGTPSVMQRLTGRKSWVRGLAVLALVGVYAAARPAINERTGLNLPALKVDSRGQVVSAKVDDRAEPKPSVSSPAATKTADLTKSPTDKTSSKKTSDAANSLDKSSPTKSTPDTKTSGPLASRVRTDSKPSAAATTNKTDASLRYGLLRDTGRERYLSPAGLLYTPGSAEGHRIEHVRRHTEDDPGRAGSHGVFDGGIEGALKTIDNAYERAKEGNRTTKQEEDGRVIYTVDMGKRVGFVGGRDGGRRNKPMARRVTLVLEDNRVITAYPK